MKFSQLTQSTRTGCAATLASVALLGCSSGSTAGSAGPGGTSGANGTSGASGIGGANGTSGANGIGGANGVAGANSAGAGNGNAGAGGGLGAGGGGIGLPHVDAGPPGPVSEWPMLAHDPSSNYWNQVETKISVPSVGGLVKAWAVDTGGNVTGTPAISGGRVYLASTGVFALDLATGNQIWKNPDVTAYSSPAVDAGVVYIHDSVGVVHALDAGSGLEIWKHAAEAPNLIGFSSPVLTKDLVIMGATGLEEVSIAKGVPASTRGFVMALKRTDGSLAWKQFTVDPPSAGVGVWSTVSIDEAASLVVVGTGNTYTGPASSTADAFVGMKLTGSGAAGTSATSATSSLLWHPQILTGDVWVQSDPHGPDGDFGANPVLYEQGGRKLAAGGDKIGDVFIIDRADGSVVKHRNLGPGTAFKGGVFVSGAWDGKSLLFAVNTAASTAPGSEPRDSAGIYGTLFALDPLTLNVKWEREYNGAAFGPISVANGVGFFGKDKILQAFNTATGQVLKEFPTEATIGTAPAISNGYVVFGSGMTWYGATGGTKYYALKVP